MKQFYLLFLVVLFAMNRSFSQSSYNYDDDGRVTNFYFKTDFYYTCRVDYDFMRQYNCVNVITSVIIDIKSDGKGRYISFSIYKRNISSFAIALNIYNDRRNYIYTIKLCKCNYVCHYIY